MANRHGFVPVLHAATDRSPDEVDTLVAAEAVAAALVRLGYKTEICFVDFDLSRLEDLAARQPLLVFNLVEAMRGDDRLFGIVPAVLEHLGLAFTGGGSADISTTLSKCRTKQLLRAAGLPTAGWSVDGATCEPGSLYIVKADLYHGSVGMDAQSVVTGAKTGAEIADRRRRYGIDFFAEQFIDGREFNVALTAGAGRVKLLPIQEIVFEDFADGQAQIVDYAAKWDPDSTVYHATPRRFGIEAREPMLAKTLAGITLAAWQALSLGGYGRVDFRVDDQGHAFVLEVNINPAIAPDAGMVAAAAEAGMAYDDLIKTIVEDGIAHHVNITKARNHA
ncbi:MAG: D-alanine--D-alanine ligase [Proteobacteria bacterium]|nr:D-alanine--D-alanine ligase [Pseudomonadota bacterium]